MRDTVNGSRSVRLGWGLAFGADLAAGGSFFDMLLAENCLLLTFESFLLGLLLLSS
jgi:hypothetical protein